MEELSVPHTKVYSYLIHQEIAVSIAVNIR